MHQAPKRVLSAPRNAQHEPSAAPATLAHSVQTAQWLAHKETTGGGEPSRGPLDSSDGNDVGLSKRGQLDKSDGSGERGPHSQNLASPLARCASDLCDGARRCPLDSNDSSDWRTCTHAERPGRVKWRLMG